MMSVLAKYKAFWKQVDAVVKEHGFQGFRVVWSGIGDCGQIDELDVITGGKRRANRSKKYTIDIYDNIMQPAPWLHDKETFAGLYNLNLVIPNCPRVKETFKDGWVKEETVGDYPLSELVIELSYVFMNHWFPGWELNDGSTGTFYFYPKYVEYTFIQYYRDLEGSDDTEGHKTYSSTVRFKDFEGFDYDDGYLGECVDASGYVEHSEE